MTRKADQVGSIANEVGRRYAGPLRLLWVERGRWYFRLMHEHGTYRYTLFGVRLGRFKWFRVSRWNVALGRVAFHWFAWPMTEVEKRERGLKRA